MQIPSAILTLVIGMVLALGGLWIGQNINLLPIDASANAPIYDELFKVLFTIGSILFIGIVGLLVFSLIRFDAAANSATALPSKETCHLKFSGQLFLLLWCCLLVCTATTFTTGWVAWCLWPMTIWAKPTTNRSGEASVQARLNQRQQQMFCPLK